MDELLLPQETRPPSISKCSIPLPHISPLAKSSTRRQRRIHIERKEGGGSERDSGGNSTPIPRKADPDDRVKLGGNALDPMGSPSHYTDEKLRNEKGPAAGLTTQDLVPNKNGTVTLVVNLKVRRSIAAQDPKLLAREWQHRMILIITSRINFSRTYRANIRLILALVVGAFCGNPAIMADTPKVWARGFTWATSSSQSKGTLALYYIDQNDSHLLGTLSYENIGRDGKASRSSIIRGVLGSDGQFYPDVSLRVRRNSKDQWTELAYPAIEGKRTQVVVGVGEINAKLIVVLDSLKRLIDEQEDGQLVLSTGDSCEFPLKYLRPPSLE